MFDADHNGDIAVEELTAFSTAWKPRHPGGSKNTAGLVGTRGFRPS